MILRRYHEESPYEYQEIDKILKRILRTYYFPKMNKVVK
jgi:Integrase zinc binding domain